MCNICIKIRLKFLQFIYLCFIIQNIYNYTSLYPNISINMRYYVLINIFIFYTFNKYVPDWLRNFRNMLQLESFLLSLILCKGNIWIILRNNYDRDLLHKISYVLLKMKEQRGFLERRLRFVTIKLCFMRSLKFMDKTLMVYRIK